MVRRLFAGGSGDSNSRSLLGLGPLRAGTAARNQYGEPRRAVLLRRDSRSANALTILPDSFETVSLLLRPVI